MQRTKQQALMFLLGAVLVGGVLGFSAERVLDRDRRPGDPRRTMYEDLSLTVVQQQQMDSLIDAINCQRKAVLSTVQPQLDSLRSHARHEMDAVLTAEQRALIEQRRKDDEARHARGRRRTACP